MLGWRSQWRLVLLNSLTCGLEICAAAGITYVPPLLLEAGMEERYMTMVLGQSGFSAPSVLLKIVCFFFSFFAQLQKTCETKQAQTFHRKEKKKSKSISSSWKRRS